MTESGAAVAVLTDLGEKPAVCLSSRPPVIDERFRVSACDAYVRADDARQVTTAREPAVHLIWQSLWCGENRIVRNQAAKILEVESEVDGRRADNRDSDRGRLLLLMNKVRQQEHGEDAEEVIEPTRDDRLCPEHLKRDCDREHREPIGVLFPCPQPNCEEKEQQVGDDIQG